MTFPVQVGAASITINRDDRFLVCQPDGRILGGIDDGFFTRDTRLISGYDLRINGRRPLLLNSAPIQFFSARFEYSNVPFLDDAGPVDRQTLSIRLDRTVDEGVHEDLDIVNYARRPVRLTIEIAIDSDFADIFDVRKDALVRRGQINTRWFRSRGELRTTYTNGPFTRELVVAVEKADSPIQYANGRLVSSPGSPEGRVARLREVAPADGPVGTVRRRPTTLPCNSVTCPVRPTAATAEVGSDPELDRPADLGPAVRDLDALRLEDPTFERNVVIPAAGVRGS